MRIINPFMYIVLTRYV